MGKPKVSVKQIHALRGQLATVDFHTGRCFDLSVTLNVVDERGWLHFSDSLDEIEHALRRCREIIAVALDGSGDAA
jgi:hypothetical protein